MVILIFVINLISFNMYQAFETETQRACRQVSTLSGC